jgi:hypothetical protein
MPFGGILFLYESDVDFLFICVSVHAVYYKFSYQFPQQLLIAWLDSLAHCFGMSYDGINFCTTLSTPCLSVGLSVEHQSWSISISVVLIFRQNALVLRILRCLWDT